MWLKEQGLYVQLRCSESGTTCILAIMGEGLDDSQWITKADTPHEAVLKAMIKVLEKESNENKNTTV